MSCRGSPTRRSFGGRFPVTLRGAVFFLLSMTILGVGVLRMELAAIVWGGAFSLIFLYFQIAGGAMLLVLRRHFRLIPDPVDFTITAGGVFPGGCTAAQVKANVPRRSPPGIGVGFEISLDWPGRESLCLRSALRGGQNRELIEICPAYRGCYQSREACITLGDLLGFVCFRHRLAQDERLRVFPSVQPERAPRPPSMEGGLEDRRDRSMRRSEDLLEVRKYFPGDDIRRVHWKVFAHTSELFLRIGEETPPPRSRMLVILDSTRSEAVPASIRADYLDGLVERCAAAALDLLGRGFQVFFSSGDSRVPKEITPDKRRELLGRLSGVWWRDEYAHELPGQHPYRVFLFSSPGSGGLPRLLGELKKRGWEVRLFFTDLPPAALRPGRRSIRRLFFRSPGGRSGGEPGAAQIAAQERRVFAKVLQQETLRWSGSGKRRVSIEIL
jgi:hypothetical protein